MRVSDILENPTCDKLSSVCSMPEQLPFKINVRPYKKNHDSKEDAYEFWNGKLPYPIICCERPYENNQK